MIVVLDAGYAAEGSDRVPNLCGFLIGAVFGACFERVEEFGAQPAPLATSWADNLASTRVTYSWMPRLVPGAVAACAISES